MAVKDVIQRAVETYGARSQHYVAIEELSELQKELCKSLRGDGNRAHIVEELADVYIMLNQVEIMYKMTDDEINAVVDYKLARLQKRLENGKK